MDNVLILRTFPTLVVRVGDSVYRRTGQCRKCGQCCNSRVLGASWEARCRFQRDDGKCGVFGRPERPTACYLFPLTPGDLERVNGCGFSFQRLPQEP